MSRPPAAASVAFTGISVIDASAGTGKTFTLVVLALRALALGHVTIDQLVVVTFTRAATLELKQRLIRDLASLLDVLTGVTAANAATPTLIDALALTDQERVDAVTRLARAERRIELARIDTIHSYAARMLTEFAIGPGAAGERLQQGAGTEVWLEAARIAWTRAQMALAPREAEVVVDVFETAVELAASVQRVSLRPDARLEPADPSTCACGAAARLGAARAALSTAAVAGAFNAYLDRLREARDRKWLSAARSTGLTDAVLDAAASALAAIAADEAALDQRRIDHLAAVMPGSDRLKPLEAGKKAGFTVPALGAAAAIETLVDEHSKWRGAFAAQFLVDAAASIAGQVAEASARRGVLPFELAIGALSSALSSDTDGHLAAAIALRYPLAMIDEFQDTDPAQYAIFSKVYRDRPNAGLIVVGDPKQAIYGFRGGDVYAYRQVIADTDSSRHHRLDINYRSSPALIDAVNVVFQHTDKPFKVDFVAFTPSRAPAPIAPVAELPMLDDDLPASVFNVLALDDPEAAGAPNKSAAEASAVIATTALVVALLNAAREGRARLPGSAPGAMRALERRDIAVLVARNDQCVEVQQALKTAGIPSISGGTGSLLAARAADVVDGWLEALVDPAASEVWRSVLIEEGFDHTPDFLIALDADAALASAWKRRFSAWRRTLIERGGAAAVLAMHGYAFAGCTPERTALSRDIEEIATRLAATLDGCRDPGALLTRWRALVVADGGDDGGWRRLPDLEADAVRVMTVHKSKGLEFGVVIAPFLWVGRKPDVRPPPMLVHSDEDGSASLWLTPAPTREALEQRDRERVAEDVRRAYVALTRAAHAVYLIISRAKDFGHSPLAALLYPSPPETVDALWAPWRKLAETGAFTLGDAPREVAALASVENDAVAAAALATAGVIDTANFSASSFSRMVANAVDARADDVGALEHDGWAGSAIDDARAADFGVAFHLALERIDWRRLDDDATWREIDAIGESRGLSVAQRAEVSHLVRRLAAATLPGGIAPSAFDNSNSMREWRFTIGWSALEARRAARALAAEPGWHAEAAVFESARLAPSGVLRGAIDLVYQNDGRFLIVDWKTNRAPDERIGVRWSAVMDAHHYRLQALLYTLALHRHLRLRSGAGYALETHLGGAHFVFVRGLDDGDAIVTVQIPPRLVDALDVALTPAKAAQREDSRR